MGDTWQLEAICEQFKCFQRLNKQQSNLKVSKDTRHFLEIVSNVVYNHLRAPVSFTKCPEREIVATIIRTAESVNNSTFSFIVIVTNQKFNDRLCTYPVFVVECGVQRLFIDLKCSVYKSWDSFLKFNDLPECKFCHPVNGIITKGKLMIDYAESSVKRSNLPRSFLNVGLEVMVSAASVAATFFFKIPPFALSCIKKLIPIAEGFISFILENEKPLRMIVQVITQYQGGRIGLFELVQQVFELLQLLLFKNRGKLSQLWEEIRRCLGSAYNYISNIYEHNDSPHEMMAITYRTDSEIRRIKWNADRQVQSTEQQTDLTISCNVNGRTLDDVSNDSFVQSIFDESKENYLNSVGSQSKSLNQETKDLITISNNIAKQLQKYTETEPHVNDVFESVSDSSTEWYRNKMNYYTKIQEAAELAAGHTIDKQVFNAALGINGDPKIYYWKKTLEKIQEPQLVKKMKTNIEQLQSKKKLLIHPLAKLRGGHRFDGLFLCKGYTRICVKDVLLVLRDRGMQLVEENVVITETNCNMLIRDENYIIFVCKDETDRQSLMCIQKI